MTKFIASAKKFVVSEDAPTMAEYGLLLALIAVVCITAIGLVGTKISSMFTQVSNSI